MIRCLGSFGAMCLSTIALVALASAPDSQPQSLPGNLDEYEHINSIVVADPESPVTGFHHFYI